MGASVTMGEGITHIVSPSSAAWCGWVMLVLLLCGILSEVFQPGVVSQAKSSLLIQRDRVYKDAPNNWAGQLMIALFRIGILAMAVYLCCDEVIPFSLARYGIVAAIIVGVMMLKMLCERWVDYTFELSRRYGTYDEHYANLVTLAVIVLYPMLLVLLRYGSMTMNRWMIGMVGVVFIAVCLYRSFRQFVSTPRAILYLLLYSCTLELLPWVLIYILSNKTISFI